MTDEFCSLRGLIAEARLKRQDIAELIGCSETMFSLYINGRRAAPPGFKESVLRAVDRLKRQRTRPRKRGRRCWPRTTLKTKSKNWCPQIPNDPQAK